MTIREYLHSFEEWFNYAAPEWMCKFTLGNVCSEPYQTVWNWLDFTLGELFFTIFLLIGVPFIFLVLLTYGEDNF